LYKGTGTTITNLGIYYGFNFKNPMVAYSELYGKIPFPDFIQKVMRIGNKGQKIC
jgi:hypothetical protein